MHASIKARELAAAEYYKNPRRCAVCGDPIGFLSLKFDPKVCSNFSCRNEYKRRNPLPPGWRVLRAERNKALQADLERLRAEYEMLAKLVASAAARA